MWTLILNVSWNFLCKKKVMQLNKNKEQKYHFHLGEGSENKLSFSSLLAETTLWKCFQWWSLTATGRNICSLYHAEVFQLSYVWGISNLPTAFQQDSHPEPSSFPFAIILLGISSRSLDHYLHFCLLTDSLMHSSVWYSMTLWPDPEGEKQTWTMILPLPCITEGMRFF